jgi:hypothetical protein
MTAIHFSWPDLILQPSITVTRESFLLVFFRDTAQGEQTQERMLL